MEISFKKWLVESKDIFGFEKKIVQPKEEREQEQKPIQAISVESMMEELLRMPLNEQKPFSKFMNHIQWGTHNGATQMVVSPLGSFKSIIRRLQTDLEGNQAWICKNILPYKDIFNANKKVDENLAYMLFYEVEKANINQLESAIGNFSNLENLVVKLTREVQKPNIKPEIFIFMGTKEMKHNEHYIIYFECKGQGVETPGSGRLEMFAIEMFYDMKKGLIRSFGHDVQSPKKGHVWYPQPSEWDENFSPAQPMAEVVDCIASALSTY
jgi:hypothetical protein